MAIMFWCVIFTALTSSIIYGIIHAKNFLQQRFMATVIELAMLSSPTKNKAKKEDYDVLLITAHPDDECMFFAPTILSLQRIGLRIHILCLSTGNLEGKGQIRSQEFKNSCQVLGCSHYKVLDQPKLADGMKHWDVIDVSRVIEAYLNNFSTIQTIVTFDRHGVSSHPNHCDLSTGIRYFASQSTKEYLLLELESQPKWLKYIGPLSLVYLATQEALQLRFSKTSSSLVLLGDWKYGVRAMSQHRSQLVWFRYLYLVFSSYLHVNSLHICRPKPL